MRIATVLLSLLLTRASSLRRVAVVTGGTRGIGRGISEALAEHDFDLLVSYNTDEAAAEQAAGELKAKYRCAVECVGGDVSLPERRAKIWETFDKVYGNTHALGAVVHNAGQYVGVTSTNAAGIKATGPPPGFGDGSLIKEGAVDFTQMHYYQRMYGDAFVDLCEQGLARFTDGGSLVGISSPGCTLQYKANLGYDMPGSGKCVMEYAMRLFALRCAGKNVNCNVVVPGVTDTDAWGKLAATRGASKEELVAGMASRLSPMGAMSPRQLGDAVAFLCSPQGRLITGVSLPIDGGVHLKS